MHKHLVEEIVTAEKTQTKQPVCLCNCLLGEKQPRDMERHEGVSQFMFPIIAQRRQNKETPIYSQSLKWEVAEVVGRRNFIMRKHNLLLALIK